MSGPETVSVIIPTFNRADRIRPTVESVLAQRLLPMEVIVVDDGSTDDTPAACATLPSLVRTVRQANAGPAAARNRGAGEARGEFVAFLDCDDYWHPEKLAVQLAALSAHPEAGWCLTDCVVGGPDGVPFDGVQGFARFFPVFAILRVTPDTWFSRFLRHAEIDVNGNRYELFVGDAYEMLFHGNFGSPSCAVVRRALFRETGGFDETFAGNAEDTEFFHRLAAASPLVVVAAPLVDYRVGQPGSLSSPAMAGQVIEGALRSLDLALRRRSPRSSRVGRAYRAGRRRLLARLAYTRLTDYDRRGARRAGFAALRAGAWTPLVMLTVLASAAPTQLLRALHTLRRQIRS